MKISGTTERDPMATAPRWIRCYDSGGSGDRYTVVFTGRRGKGLYLGMNDKPFHPQGIGMHGEGPNGRAIDRPTSGHLGKRIAFTALPPDCQKAVRQDYEEIWK